ncbi:partial Sporulation kinase E, partial [Anaerolineae bacterium]
RSDPARETHQSGSGLGLAIAQKVIQAHQGRIEVQSEVGKGTIFHLIFPFQHEQPPEQNKAP